MMDGPRPGWLPRMGAPKSPCSSTGLSSPGKRRPRWSWRRWSPPSDPAGAACGFEKRLHRREGGGGNLQRASPKRLGLGRAGLGAGLGDGVARRGGCRREGWRSLGSRHDFGPSWTWGLPWRAGRRGAGAGTSMDGPAAMQEDSNGDPGLASPADLNGLRWVGGTVESESLAGYNEGAAKKNGRMGWGR